MSVAAPAPAASADQPATPAPAAPAKRVWPAHALAAGIASAIAVLLTAGLWADPYDHVLAVNVGDQAFFEWVLSYGVYLLGHGANPFFTHLMNAPLGVNLAVNTSITAYSVLFS